MVRLTDRPDMTLEATVGVKQQHNNVTHIVPRFMSVPTAEHTKLS